MVSHHPDEKKFQVDDALLQEFRKFMDSENVQYTEAELQQNLDWVKSNIKSEIFIDALARMKG